MLIFIQYNFEPAVYATIAFEHWSLYSLGLFNSLFQWNLTHDSHSKEPSLQTVTNG
jgi:hypothetical protein